MEHDTPTVYGVKRAAKRLGVSRPTLYEWIERGIIKVTVNNEQTPLFSDNEIERVKREHQRWSRGRKAEHADG